ncbi:hypothetical protein OC846_005270 [Tilletia horrida]|uniref:PH domain-containing protein n=1 Tax=Tilletia horrida TaxID=155126 RepID=A0AAN6GLQ3_9BASI|nr:hypothetical protein OC846_005270 [Tilletia horrida]KAK0562203.1 hypothetical protein OC861_005437 [Tilletia horrida]
MLPPPPPAKDDRPGFPRSFSNNNIPAPARRSTRDYGNHTVAVHVTTEDGTDLGLHHSHPHHIDDDLDEDGDDDEEADYQRILASPFSNKNNRKTMMTFRTEATDIRLEREKDEFLEWKRLEEKRSEAVERARSRQQERERIRQDERKRDELMRKLMAEQEQDDDILHSGSSPSPTDYNRSISRTAVISRAGKSIGPDRVIPPPLPPPPPTPLPQLPLPPVAKSLVNPQKLKATGWVVEGDPAHTTTTGTSINGNSSIKNHSSSHQHYPPVAAAPPASFAHGVAASSLGHQSSSSFTHINPPSSFAHGAAGGPASSSSHSHNRRVAHPRRSHTHSESNTSGGPLPPLPPSSPTPSTSRLSQSQQRRPSSSSELSPPPSSTAVNNIPKSSSSTSLARPASSDRSRSPGSASPTPPPPGPPPPAPLPDRIRTVSSASSQRQHRDQTQPQSPVSPSSPRKSQQLGSTLKREQAARATSPARQQSQSKSHRSETPPREENKKEYEASLSSSASSIRLSRIGSSSTTPFPKLLAESLYFPPIPTSSSSQSSSQTPPTKAKQETRSNSSTEFLNLHAPLPHQTSKRISANSTNTTLTTSLPPTPTTPTTPVSVPYTKDLHTSALPPLPEEEVQLKAKAQRARDQQRLLDERVRASERKTQERAEKDAIARAKWAKEQATRDRLDAWERSVLESAERKRREQVEKLREEESRRVEEARRESELQAEEERAALAEADRRRELAKEREARIKREYELRVAGDEAALARAAEREEARLKLKMRLEELELGKSMVLNGSITVQLGDSLIWRRRWFELRGNSMLLFKSEREKAEVLERIDLRGTIQDISDAYEECQMVNSFKVTFVEGAPLASITAYTDTPEDKDVLRSGIEVVSSIEL